MAVESLEPIGYTRSMKKKPIRPGRPVPGLLSVKEAAARKGVSKTAIYNALATGKLRAQRVGETLVLSEWEVEEWGPAPRGPLPKDGRRNAEPSK